MTYSMSGTILTTGHINMIKKWSLLSISSKYSWKERHTPTNVISCISTGAGPTMERVYPKEGYVILQRMGGRRKLRESHLSSIPGRGNTTCKGMKQ